MNNCYWCFCNLPPHIGCRGISNFCRCEPRNLANWPAEFWEICRGKLWSLLTADYIYHSQLTRYITLSIITYTKHHRNTSVIILQIEPGQFFDDRAWQLLPVSSATLSAVLCPETRCHRLVAVSLLLTSLPSKLMSSSHNNQYNIQHQTALMLYH